MDANTLFSTLKSLQGDVSWNLVTVQEVISEIAVITKTPTIDTVLPLVLAVLDKAKAVAISKVPQGKSSDEIAQQFDELKILAKHFVPVVVSALTAAVAVVEVVKAGKGCGCFSWFSSRAAALKKIDQTTQVSEKVLEKVLEKVDDIVKEVAPLEVVLTGDSKVADKVEAVVEEVEKKD